MQSLCWCQLDPVGFALAPSMLTVATENRETMVNSTDVAPEFVGAAYEPMGKIEAGGEQAYEYVAPKEPTDWGTGKRLGMMVGHENYFNSQEAYSKYQEFCEVTKIENIGGQEYHDLAESTYAYIHRPNNGDSNGGACMVYFHGGAMIAGGPEQSTVFLNRYLFAPESRTPCQIVDAYASGTLLKRTLLSST